MHIVEDVDSDMGVEVGLRSNPRMGMVREAGHRWGLYSELVEDAAYALPGLEEA